VKAVLSLTIKSPRSAALISRIWNKIKKFKQRLEIKIVKGARKLDEGKLK
jgi:hypothetical protein